MLDQIITESKRTPVSTSISSEQVISVVTNPTQLLNVLIPFNSAHAIAIDTETTGLDPLKDKVRLIQIATPKQPTIVIDLFRFQPLELTPVWDLLNGPAVKIFHNAKFDMKFLVQAGLPIIRNVFDTMISAQLLKAGLQRDGFKLADLVKEYLKEELPKELQKSDWSLTLRSEQLRYAAKDAEILLRLFPPIYKDLSSNGLLEVAHIESECIFSVAQMELTGIHIDKKAIGALGLKLQHERKRLRSKLREYFTDVFPDLNPDSPDQVKKALCASGIKVEGTGKDVLTQLKDKHPIIRDILDYRSVAKSIGVFTEKLPGHVHEFTDRIHPDFWQMGSETGRFSCSNPNLQQVPRGKEFRSCFIPARGHKFVIANYSQIELRIAAEISGDSKMISAYSKGIDLHQLTASLVNGKPIEQITKEERQAAKAVNFGLIYGMGADGLRAYAKSTYNLDMTPAVAATFRQRFFEGYQGLAQWHKRTDANRRAHSRTLSGRRRQWQYPPITTILLNTPVQGTSADFLKIALGKLPTVLSGTGAKIVACIHDEVILEVPESHAEAAAIILKEVMESAGQKYLKKVPVLAEPAIVDNWAEK